MFWQGKPYQSTNQLVNAVKQLNNQQSYRYLERFRLIVSSACGNQGVLTSFVQQQMANLPSFWAQQQDNLLDNLTPDSPFFSKLSQNANMPTPIDVKYLPKSVLEEFPQHLAYESRKMHGLRRDAGGNYTIGLWQWFWSNIIVSLLQISQSESVDKPQQSQQQDEFFNHISRNIYLRIIQNSLRKLASSKSNLMGRLLYLIEVHVIDELTFRLRTKGSQIAYRLRAQHLHLFFFLVHFRQLSQETALYYYDFLSTIAQNYSSLTLSQHSNIRNLLRVWLALVTRQSGIGSLLLQKISKANQVQGLFRLGRCPPQRFAQAMQRLEVNGREISKAVNTRSKLLRLLSRTSQWPADYSHFAVVQQLIIFDHKVLERYRIDLDTADLEIMVKSIQRTLGKLSEGIMKDSSLQNLHNRIGKLISERKKGVSLKIKAETLLQRRKNPQKSRLSATNLQRRTGISYHNPLRRNIWTYPLQQNQFYLLYKAMFWLSQQIDKALPGYQLRNPNEPSVNLRPLCNPTVFVVLLLIIVTIWKLVL